MEVRTLNEVKTDSKLKQLFYFLIKDTYTAEKKVIKFMPELMESATSGELKMALGDHLQESTAHVQRLKEIFAMMNFEKEEGNCSAISGIIREAKEIVDETHEETAQRDAGIIVAVQMIEHYEIATYSALIEMAKTIGHNDAVALLQKNLEEEKKADEILTKTASTPGGVNEEAVKEPAEID